MATNGFKNYSIKFSWLSQTWARLKNDKMGLLGFVLVITVVLVAIFAHFLAPYDPNMINISHRLQAPSLVHLLGTDHLGRDTLSRVIVGSRIALKVAMISISLAMSGGLILGLLAGYGPAWLDRIMILIFDTVRSFPTVMFALALVTMLGPSLNTIIIVVVITSIPMYGRIVRAQTLSLKNKEFIWAERSTGAGMVRILAVHMLPNVIGPLLIIASMDVPVVVTIEAGLSFLGVGVRPPAPSWGSILNDGYAYIRNTTWIAIAGGVPLILTTVGFTFLGESLRDIFDPKLQKDI